MEKSEKMKYKWELQDKREKEKKEQVINFIVLMMEEHNIDIGDLQ